jgi:hypothetical protein
LIGFAEKKHRALGSVVRNRCERMNGRIQIDVLKQDRNDFSAKFWLDPVQLAANFGFRAHELRTIQSIVLDQREQFLEAWNEFFGGSGG